jgi:RNA 3'-terminal phosphate cyclase (ATP)
MQRAGADISLELVHHGFFPAGGGEVIMRTKPVPALSPLHLTTPAESRVELQAIVSALPEGIARRELTAAAELLHGTSVSLTSASVRSPGPGNAVWLSAPGHESGPTNVFSAIGEVDVRAEELGCRIAESYLAWRRSGASVEAHLADQIMLPIALAGEGSYTCDSLTLHALTNIEVIRAFTGHRLRAWSLGDAMVRVALER